MARLHSYSSTKIAGNTTNLLQSACSYRERVMRTLIMMPRLDDRFGAATLNYASALRPAG